MNTFIYRVLTAIAVSSAISNATSAEAVSLAIGGLRFSEISGNFSIVNGRVDSDGFYTIEQDVYGPDTTLYMSIDGFPRLCPRCSYVGIGFQSVLRNLTGTPWIFVDHEVQEVYGFPSPEADGLSFGQFLPQFRPFTSTRFGLAEEEIDVRDYVNFSGGIVAPGDTAVFRYIFTDTSPIDRFFLLQRPNFQPRVGFIDPTPRPPVEVVVTNPTPIEPTPVQPTPIEPTPIEPTPVQPTPIEPTPIEPTPVQSVPVIEVPMSTEGEVAPEENSAAAVPEPTTVLGALMFGAIAIHKRLQRKD
ncbi:hypothetical protein [Leptolyngbya sp. Cla-17]|uniref:hypothetical protein n=1 Tax=Leptolyngbya sp. Cla-17 TaxID=2803751 RepID=UPI0018D7EE97|nr:hypothetical protein [Leptolyngbya sp. Cla-17]